VQAHSRAPSYRLAQRLGGLVAVLKCDGIASTILSPLPLRERELSEPLRAKRVRGRRRPPGRRVSERTPTRRVGYAKRAAWSNPSPGSLRAGAQLATLSRKGRGEESGPRTFQRVFSKISRPMSMRRISEVPAPIS
jgi:hypothetical protein